MTGLNKLRLATRGSPLAYRQANKVASLLMSVDHGLEVEILTVHSTGDLKADISISELGGQGVFVKEIQQAVLSCDADIAVHSAKDLPSNDLEALFLAAVVKRDDRRDGLVNYQTSLSSMFEIPTGSLIATGSSRRRCQLAWIRPDLVFCDLRGNIETRLAKIKKLGAIAPMALCALDRLELRSPALYVLPLPTYLMLPQAGQGAIAVECRRDDEPVKKLLLEIDDRQANLEVKAERAFLSTLGAGCDLPVGACAHRETDSLCPDLLHLEVMLASLDGRVVIKRNASGQDPVELGTVLAKQLLDDCGEELLPIFRKAEEKVDRR
ncbi:MAG: hydroxymethylbilane synthase [Actinobacteria bacterium]|nr:hydroxymethylbilane synthase [Actinomycetota bacterium]